MAMAVGVPLGPYVLLRKLAKGGMAEIFLAKKEGPEGFARELVVKRMLPHLTADPALSELFRAEARIVARMNHPNVVHVYDFGEEGGTGYLVMELVRGVDLCALIERATAVSQRTGRSGAIPPHHAAKLLSFVCEGLAHAHALSDGERTAQLVHRDVTPSNVLVSFDGAVKVADFGVAKLQRAGREDTGTGMVRGKFAYLSPEQARGESLDARSDLYNVGILLYEMVTGEDLFPHDDARTARMMAAAGVVPKPQRLAQLGPELEAVARRVLSARREDRYSDALAMRRDLESYLRSRQKTSDSVEIGRYVRALFPDVLAADRRGPRAAGTVQLTEAAPEGTALMTGPVTPVFHDLEAADTDARDFPQPETQAPSSGRRWGLALLALLGVAVFGVSAAVLLGGPTPPDAPRVTPLPPSRPQAPLPASLRVRSVPAGLEIRLDGENRGPAPLVLDVVPGTHSLEALHEGRVVGRRSFQVEPGAALDLAIEAEVPGRMHVATSPDGAAIHVSGEFVGRSPLDVELASGTHSVEITLEGHEPHVESVEITPRAVASLSVSLRTSPAVTRMGGRMVRPVRATGLLTISSTPWSTVFLGNRRLGITPLARVTLPEGSHTLTLRADGHAPKRRTVVIRAGEETRVREVL